MAFFRSTGSLPAFLSFACNEGGEASRDRGDDGPSAPASISKKRQWDDRVILAGLSNLILAAAKVFCGLENNRKIVRFETDYNDRHWVIQRDDDEVFGADLSKNDVCSR